MSYALAALRFNDGTIRYCQYDGNSDTVVAPHYETIKQVVENWRQEKWISCQCGQEEPVSICVTYGKGYYIRGYACQHCKNVYGFPWDMEEYDNFINENWAKDLPIFNQ